MDSLANVPMLGMQVYVTQGTGSSAIRGHCPRDLLSATQSQDSGGVSLVTLGSQSPWILWTIRNQSPQALSPAMEIAQGEFGATLCLLILYFLVPGTQKNLGPFWFLFWQSRFLDKALGASCLVVGTFFFTVRKFGLLSSYYHCRHLCLRLHHHHHHQPIICVPNLSYQLSLFWLPFLSNSVVLIPVNGIWMNLVQAIAL